MSKYLDHIGKNLPKYANEDEYGFSNPFAEGGALEILNPVTAYKSYSKKGLAAVTPFVDELKDYKQVRDEISNRPLILRKAAQKMRGVRFDQSHGKKIFQTIKGLVGQMYYRKRQHHLRKRMLLLLRCSISVETFIKRMNYFKLEINF